jgi:hypothetical protein
MSDIQNLCDNYNPKTDKGLIIIADISGFTNYINVTEIEHSQKNIAKLLESIIDANELELSVSEIEGDAVFFFKFENTDSYSALINQIKKMADNFYTTLSNLSGNKSCNCGACSVLSELNIKFIVHAGNIGTIMIKDFCKLYGIDIIVAHRLLKNNVPIDNYALFTNKVVRKFSNDNEKSFTGDTDYIWEEDVYEDINAVKYLYIPLKSLMKK